MPSPVFHFKQFSICQDKCSMKVGTDGVLLGAWTKILSENKESALKLNPSSPIKILDIGTGTGLIALMLAQKISSATEKNSECFIIDAIDSDESSCVQANENITKSKYKEKVNVIHQPLHQFCEKADSNSYHLIVSNPPFFNKSLKSPYGSRNRARHSDSADLSREVLISSLHKLLMEDGRFCLILPKMEGEGFIEEAEKQNLYCTRLTKVFPKPGKECKRLLLQFERVQKKRKENTLYLETGKVLNDFSAGYKKLTSEFYLNF